MLRRRNEVDAGGLQARMLGVNIDHVERDVADADVAGRPSLAGLRLRLRIAEHFHLHVAELELCDLPARLAHADDVPEWFEAAWTPRHAHQLHAEPLDIEHDEAYHFGRPPPRVVPP